MSAVHTTELQEDEARASLGSAAVIIWNDVASEGRDQFYEWHDREHIPERLSLPGFLRGRRFASAGHSPEWLTLYEAEDLSVLTSPAYLSRLNAPTPATQRTLMHFRNTSRAVCRVVHTDGSSTGGHVLAMRLGVEAGRAAAMCEFLIGEAFPQAMRSTGVVACHLYSADDRASYVETSESSTRTFDVPSWVLLCETTFRDAAEHARRLFDSAGLRALDVKVRDDAATYALEICRLARTRHD